MSRLATFRWSVRREIWEHRGIYLAPLAIAALVLLGFFIHAGQWAGNLQGIETLAPARQVRAVILPFGLGASVILLTAWIVGMFYCLDALNAERRDRSILFWKSMPVSDRTTVLAKAAIPLAVLPLVAFAVALATQVVMLVVGSAVLAAKGMSLATPWTYVPWVQTTLAQLYGMATHALWFAPIFGWLLLVSAWAKRHPFLWAFMPFFAAMVLEKIAFGTQYVWFLIGYRITGGMRAFKGDATKDTITQLSQLDPLAFFALPGLWLGLVFAAVCLAAAVRLRRRREPI
jgi:ABC-2 type transport system permease protein